MQDGRLRYRDVATVTPCAVEARLVVQYHLSVRCLGVVHVEAVPAGRLRAGLEGAGIDGGGHPCRCVAVGAPGVQGRLRGDLERVAGQEAPAVHLGGDPERRGCEVGDQYPHGLQHLLAERRVQPEPIPAGDRVGGNGELSVVRAERGQRDGGALEHRLAARVDHGELIGSRARRAEALVTLVAHVELVLDALAGPVDALRRRSPCPQVAVAGPQPGADRRPRRAPRVDLVRPVERHQGDVIVAGDGDEEPGVVRLVEPLELRAQQIEPGQHGHAVGSGLGPGKPCRAA